jgi:hypothetical protein
MNECMNGYMMHASVIIIAYTANDITAATMSIHIIHTTSSKQTNNQAS